MADLDLLSTKRTLLSKIVDTYTSAQADLTAAVSVVNQRLDDATAAENAEAASLAQTQKQVDSLSLKADLDALNATQVALTTKADTFTNLVQANNTAAAAVFDAVKASQDLMDQIMSTISNIRANIATINSAIDRSNVLPVKTAHPLVESTVPAPDQAAASPSA